MTVESLITQHIDTWTSAVKTKSTTGRGSRKKLDLYGIKKLRELILELAVRGKLVPQEPNDEPASVLLERIAAEKAQLVKDKKLKKQKSGGKVIDDEVLFDLPSSWEWTRLSEIAEIGPRNTDVKDELEVSFIPMPLISTSYKGDHGSEIKHWKDIKKGYTHFCDGDIALAKITPCFENSKAAVFSNLKNGIGAGTTELHVARPVTDLFEALFVLLYLKAPMFLKVGETKMTGSAGQKRVPKDFFAGNPLPFPPQKEQHRIVAKVDELMTLCDQLEQQTEACIEAHQLLVSTLLNTLTNSADADELMENWARISDHFDTLFTTEESIDQLKQTILQLAVMGKLVPQDPNDEPASVLLERIAEEKAQLIKEKKIKKQKALPPIADDEKPFDLPNGWEWARFDSLPLSYCVGLDRGKNLQGTDKQYRYFKMNNISNVGGIDLSTIVYVDANDAEVEQYKLKNNDFLFNTRNSKELVGKTCVYTEMFAEPMLYNNNILRASFTEKNLSFMLDIWMRSPIGKAVLELVKSGTTNVWAIYQGKLALIPCTIPPLEEQHRIVVKVDELMALCNQLKARLERSQATQLHLTDAIVEQAV
ncbi:restriction endonuclease subunit S [Photobacterium toruni]|uniref:restriction endonuclease subunit S n=1 Tax=Photobacterium toruni TaxID=1935446 RepID=UPI002E19AE5A|nr:restriction endonuclease subunit S [Photobacterium toruni]